MSDTPNVYTGSTGGSSSFSTSVEDCDASMAKAFSSP